MGLRLDEAGTHVNKRVLLLASPSTTILNDSIIEDYF